MKHLQLLTFILTTLPLCTNALVLGTGISSQTQSNNRSSTSSATSTSFSTSTSSIFSTTTSSTNAVPIGSFIALPFVGSSTSISNSTSPTSSQLSTSSQLNTTSQLSTLGTGFGTLVAGTGGRLPPSSSSPSSGLVPSNNPSFYPTGSDRGSLNQNIQSTSASGRPIYQIRPNHKPSSIGSLPSNGFPKAALTAGTGVPASGVFPLSGSGSSGGSATGTGVAKGIYPSGTGAVGASSGILSGIFPPTGTNPKLTASGGANSTVPTRAASCGLCDVIIPQVQVQYFPDGPNPNATCAQSIGAGPSITPPPAPALVKRRLARRNGTLTEDIAVSGDYTFTSPSMYVVMSQGIHVTDRCGTIGSSLASAVVPVSSGSLQSVSYNIAVGQTLTTAVMTATSYTKPVRPEDLACPTWGISGNWNPRPNADPLDMPGGIDLNVPAAASAGATSLAVIGIVQVDTVVGPPWYPILVLPHEVLGLDPLWQSCVGRLLNPSFPIFDPPHALQGQTELVSSAGPAYAQAEVTTNANNGGPPQGQATPASQSLLVPTGNTGSDGSQKQVVNPGSQSSAGGLGVVKIPESQLVQPSPLALAPAATSNVAAPAQVSAEADTNPQVAVNVPSASPAAENSVFLNSLSAALAVSTVNVVPVAAYAANSPGPNTPAPLSVAGIANPPALNTPAPLSVAGQQVQQEGSTLVVGSQSIAPGSTASVGGHQVINNGKNVVVDGSSQEIQSNPAPPPAVLPSVGGQEVQQSGSNLVVAGQTITPGSTGSVGGHAVVNNGNNVVIDGSSHPIQPTPTPVLVAGGPANEGTTGVAPAFQGEGGNTAAVPLPSVGGQQIQQQGSSLVVAGQTIAPDATATINGHQVVNNGNAVVVDGSTQALPPTEVAAPNPNIGAAPPPQGQPPLTIGGSTYLPTGPSSAYDLPGGQTLTPGAQVTVGGVPVSLAQDGSAAVVGGSTENLAPIITPPPGQPAITFAGSTFRPLGASSAYIINGQTLAPGANPITVSGTPISLYSNGATAVVGSSTENLQPPTTSVPGLTFDGTTYQPTNVGGISSAYVIHGQTITPGAGPVTLSGTPISIAPNGNSAVVGGIKENLAPSGVPEPALTFDGSTIHPVTGAPSDYVIHGQTLTPGGMITVSGTPISLATNAASAIIGSSTENLQMTEPPLVFGGSTYYPTGSSSAYVIDGQTITRGASLTISGTPISLASNGASAIVGTSTEDLLPSLTSGAVLTIGGQTFTPNPSSFVLDGKTMTVGGSAIISGTPIALEPSGTLMVGTSEIPLATSSGNLVAPSNKPLAGLAVDRRRVPFSSMAMCLVGLGTLYII